MVTLSDVTDRAAISSCAPVRNNAPQAQERRRLQELTIAWPDLFTAKLTLPTHWIHSQSRQAPTDSRGDINREKHMRESQL